MKFTDGRFLTFVPLSIVLSLEYPLDTVLNGDAPEKTVEKAIRKYESKQGKRLPPDVVVQVLTVSYSGAVFTDKSDPRVVASVLKTYLESLPEPVILSSLYYEFNSNASKSFRL